MILTAYLSDVGVTEIAVLHTDDANKIGIREGDKISVYNKTTKKTSIMQVALSSATEEMRGYIGISKRNGIKFTIKNGDILDIEPASAPKSVNYIHKKIDGELLTRNEISSIITDSINGSLNSNEISAFLVAMQIRGMNTDETEYLTREMTSCGDMITFDKKPVIDHHSIGGVPGNKVTLLVVPIIAAAGYLIPKTCSRAITGAGGTADLMEAVANVSFSASEIKEMTEKVGGVIVWGGGANFAPADDIFINCEKPLKINPRSKMVASIISKKLAAGATHCLMDIPVGPGSKYENEADGRKVAAELAAIGERVGIKIRSAITYGGTPIGRTIGVNLEVSEALRALENRKDSSSSLFQKSTILAGMALEMVNAVPRGNGVDAASNYIKSGKALEKMKDIIEIQGGDRNVTSDDLVPGDFSFDIEAPNNGYVLTLLNKSFVEIARAAGSPTDHGAGIYIHKKPGQPVKKGEKLYTVYAEKEWKLTNALKIATEHLPMTVGSMLLDSIE